MARWAVVSLVAAAPARAVPEKDTLETAARSRGAPKKAAAVTSPAAG